MTGRLIGVGVGPGDPDLLTVRADRIVRSASFVAYPAPDTGQSFARQIVDGLIPRGAREYPIVVPMRTDRFPAQEIYSAAARDLSPVLEGGTDVVVLCEGDPFFYGSFMYLFARLAERFPTEIVPGVSSLGAVAAAARQPLCARSDVLTIVPATLPEEDLRQRLAETDAAAIMKLGRHFPKVRRVLDDLGLTDRAQYVAHASLPQQSVHTLTGAPATAPYFSMIIVPGVDAFV